MKQTKINYWNSFYKKDNENILIESSFARYCLPYIRERNTLLDIGCGNGRDTKFFYENGVTSIGLDFSFNAIKSTNINYNLGFYVVQDIKELIKINIGIQNIYLRWVLHSLDEELEDKLLEWCSLNYGKSMLFIECRTIYDEKQYDDNHYRRLIVPDKLIKKLKALGFEIIKHDIGKFSKLGKDHPVLLRIIAKKKK